MISSAKEWLYFLIKGDGRSKYQDDITSEIKETSTPTPLKYTPDAWMDISFGFERDRKRHGMKPMYSFPLGFVIDGAKIIRDTVYRFGQEAELFLLITRRTIEFTDTDYADYHKKWVRAPLDLSSCVDEEHKITVKIDEFGLAKKLKANEETVYEFPLDDPEAINVKMDGMFLEDTVTFSVPYATEPIFGDHFIPAGMTVRDGNAAGFAGFQVFYDKFEDPRISEKYLFRTTQLITGMSVKGHIRVRITYSFKPTNPSASYIIFLDSNQRNVFTAGHPGAIEKIITPTPDLINDIDIPIDFTIDGGVDEKFFLYANWNSVPGIIKVEYLVSEFTVSYRSRYRSTVVRAFQPHILLDKIIEKICGQRNKTVSNLLASLKYRDLVLTSGDGLRSLPGSVVKLSYNTFFSVYQVCTFAGMEISGEKLLMEIIDTYYDSSNPIPLGEAATIKVSTDTEWQGNTVKIGHKQKDPEEVNGRYSFNNSFTWNTKRETVIKEIKIVSDAVCDPYTIESLRINFNGKTTTDADGDNEIYLLATEPDTDDSFTVDLEFVMVFGVFAAIIIKGQPDKAAKFTIGQNVPITGTASNDAVYQVLGVQSAPGNPNFVLFVSKAVTAEVVSGATIGLKYNRLLRKTYDSITGVPADIDIFNIELLSPKRILNLWSRWINSSFYKMDGTQLVFGTTERNADLKTVLGSEVIEEKAPYTIARQIMWKPIKVDITISTPVDLIALKTESPNRCYSFIWENRIYKIFDLKSGTQPDDNRPQVFSGLLTADTDETYLIR